MCTGTPELSASVAAVWRSTCSVPMGIPGGRSMLAEPLREPLWVDQTTQLVGEHKVLVLVGVGGEVALEQLRLAVRAQHVDRLGVERDRAPEPAHPWERQLRDLERAIQETPEVPPPLPRWAGLNHRQEQDNAARVERQRRRGELSADDRAALAMGRVVTLP